MVARLETLLRQVGKKLTDEEKEMLLLQYSDDDFTVFSKLGSLFVQCQGATVEIIPDSHEKGCNILLHRSNASKVVRKGEPIIQITPYAKKKRLRS